MVISWALTNRNGHFLWDQPGVGEPVDFSTMAGTSFPSPYFMRVNGWPQRTKREGHRSHFTRPLIDDLPS